MGSGPSLALSVCPLTGVPFVDPVICQSDGHTYSREAITKWHHFWRDQIPGPPVLSPLTREPMGAKLELRPDMDARSALEQLQSSQKGSKRNSQAGDARTITSNGQIAAIYEMNQVFTALVPYRDLLQTVTAAWHAPQLVVLGDIGSGKSTLLERLLMMSLLPRGKGIRTRACIQVRLRHALQAQTPQLEVIDAKTGARVRGPYPIASENGRSHVEEELQKLLAEEAQEMQEMQKKKKGLFAGCVVPSEEKQKKSKKQKNSNKKQRKKSNDSLDTEKSGEKELEVDAEEAENVEEAENAEESVEAEVQKSEQISTAVAEVQKSEQINTAVEMCSSRIIVIHVDGPHLPSIDVVDLPGLSEAPGEDATHALAYGQLSARRGRSLCLLVAPVSSMGASSSATNILESFSSLHDRTLRVHTHCDTSVQHLRKRLENAGDWVCTACPPSQADIPQASRLSHGNLLELQHRANSEVAFFEGEGFAELLKKGSLGTNALQSKIGKLYKDDLLQSWAPQVIWCLNRERARLRFRLAVLGPPTPSSREEVERFRSGMTRAAKSVLREAASSITRIVAREALAPLEKEITDLLAAEISCAMDDHSSQWQNLEHQVSEACQIAVTNAARCISTCLLALMEHEEPSPAWPSVEAEEFVSQQMYVPARFPKFVKAVVKEMSNMLGPWKTKVNAGLKVCVGKIFDVASPFVKMRARLAANPPQIRMRFAHEDVVGLLISAALRYDLCASRLFSKLVDSISDVVEEVQEWSDSRSGERDVLQQRLEKLESTRKELLQILGISTGPPGLAALDEISLARTSCSGVGVSYAWRKMNSQFRITVRGQNGTILSRSMPGDHRFEVSVLPVGAPSQSRQLVGASRLEHIPVQDNSDGTHTVSYRIPQDAAAGDMELSVQLYGCHVKGSPFSLQVSDEPSWSSVLVLGSGDEELHQPSGITRLGDDIYVADLISNHILVYRGDAVVRKITSAGSDNGRTGSFNKPWGLAVDDDALYVVESGSDCVKAIGKVDGVLLQTLGSSGSGDGEFRDPRGIVLDGDSLYVVDCGNHRVHVFMRKRGGAFQLERYFGSSGSEEAQFKDPCDLDIDGDYIHVCDQNNHRIQVFGKKAGIYLFTYGSKGTGDGQLWSPTSVVVGESYSYVSDGGNHRIQVFDKSDGTFIKSIAAKGRTNGFLREPGCLALYGDDLYVCEKGNRRVQVFRYGECRL